MRRIFIKSMKFDPKAGKMVVVESLVVDEKDFGDWIKLLSDGVYSLKIDIFSNE